MKRLAFLGIKPCMRCQQPAAFLMTKDGKHTFGIALDRNKAREISRNFDEPGKEKFLTGLLLRLLASSSYVPHQVVLDFNEEGYLSATVDVTTEIFSCSPQEGVALAVTAGIPLYAAERIFEHRHLFHPLDTESEGTDLLQPKAKPTLH